MTRWIAHESVITRSLLLLLLSPSSSSSSSSHLPPPHFSPPLFLHFSIHSLSSFLTPPSPSSFSFLLLLLLLTILPLPPHPHLQYAHPALPRVLQAMAASIPVAVCSSSNKETVDEVTFPALSSTECNQDPLCQIQALFAMQPLTGVMDYAQSCSRTEADRF